MEFVLVIVLGIYTLTLASRVKKLEAQLGLRKEEASSATTPPTQVRQPERLYPDAPYDIQTANQPMTQIPSPAPVATGPNPFIEWVKQDFLVKLGALLLLIALGWFVSYAFANNWIGPAGRITIGLLVGLVFMVVGVKRISFAKHQGSIFTVLGATTVILTMFAARELYGFFTPFTALLVMFMSVAFVTFVSLRYETERLAVAGLILGMMAPLLTASPTPDTVSLFLYLTIIVFGTLWVVFLTGWRTLTPLALLSVALWTAPYLEPRFVSEADQDVALLFVFAFTAIFFVTNVVSVVRRPFKQYLNAQIVTAIFTALFLVTWVAAAVSEHLQSLLYSAWALVFAIGAYFVFAHTNNKQVFYIYGATSVGLIGAATAAELSGAVLTIAFTLEIALFIMVAAALRAPNEIIRNISFLFAIPALMSLPSLEPSQWRDSVLHSDAFVVVLMVLITFRVAGFLFNRARALNDEVMLTIASVFYAAGAFYASALVWLATHAILPYDMATTLSLIVYTIVGLLLYLQGRHFEYRLISIIGMVLIGAVVARLLLVDIWNMPISGRIITFFIIGLMLISTAFSRRRHIKE